MYVCMYVCVRMYLRMYVCTHICMHACVQVTCQSSNDDATFTGPTNLKTKMVQNTINFLGPENHVLSYVTSTSYGKLPLHWVPGVLTLRRSGQGVKLPTPLHLVRRLRVTEAPLTHMPSWRTRG